ncbi:MAG: adenylate cyclase [Lysobacterales bacterium]|jgi:adenylate cyclase
MSFFGELKRRNVARVAIAYAVASWVLTQIGDVAAQSFEAPVWVMKMFMTALIAGFPIVLFFSWAYEITPEGIKKESEIDRSQSISNETGKKLEYVTIALLLMAIAFIAVDRFVPQQATQEVVATEPTVETVTAEPTSPESLIDDNSIAVLPFLNMSNDPEQEYFSDGIAEELLNLLVRVDGLQVASRTSSFAYKGESPNIPQIASDLKVANILEGSVRKAGNRVRITAQLIDTRNDRHLWSETYDRELTDIFAIQDEIANAIVNALRTELGLDISEQIIEVAATTENLDAYDLYLKGRGLFISRQRLDESVRLLERAVDLDPQYARAWADLGAVAWVAPGWNYIDRDYVAISKHATEMALKLDENQSMPWAVKSYLRHEDPSGRDYEETLAFLDIAIEKDPKNTTAILWRGLAWAELGFFDKALADFEHCLEIDRGYLNCRFHVGYVQIITGNHEIFVQNSKELYRKGFRGAISLMVPLLIKQGNDLAAFLAAAQISDHPDYPLTEWLEALEHPDKDYSAAVEKAEKWLAQEPTIGMRENLMKAFGAYNRLTIDVHLPSEWLWISNRADFHKSADFKRLVNELNLPVYWREHGFPPQCRAVGEEGFECD